MADLRTEISNSAENDEIEEINSINNLEDAGESETAAALRVFVLMASPNFEPSTPEDTAMTVLFELLFQLVSPIGLLANLASLISLADRWRMRAAVNETEETVHDVSWVLAVNAVALGVGFFANFVLFMHAELWFTRRISMLITGCCYMSAVCLYMGLLGAVEYDYFGTNHDGVHRTLGYWQAVCASVLYFVASFVLALHMWYFRHRKWDKRLSRRQRQLMILCIIYVAWIMIGAASFQARSMLDKNFAEATYFVVVSYLTLGYGDITPPNNLSRALDLPFLYTGIVLSGLVSYMIFQAVLGTAHSKAVIAGIQRDQHSLLKKWEEDDAQLELTRTNTTRSNLHAKSDSQNSSQESDNVLPASRSAHTEKEGFDAIHRIVSRWRASQTRWQLIFISLWVIIFWLIGALIFSYTEGWEYFHAFYMCGISLSSVGYGDFVPTSSGGRSVFIHWAILALPTMSAAVSSICSAFITFFSVERILKLVDKYFKRKDREHPAEFNHQNHIDAWFGHRKLADMLPESITPEMLQELSHSSDDSVFSFEIWHAVITALHQCDELPANYWISDASPLSVPGLNEKHVLTLMVIHLINPENFAPPSKARDRR